MFTSNNQLSDKGTGQREYLGPLDLTLFAGSLAITVFIGLYFANKNKTFADYARGGGNQNLWAVSASMAAGYCSALTLIGNPSELYMHGTSFTLKMATTILAWPISSFILLPVFRQLDGISIFQFVELRFHPILRRFISLLFIGQMLFYSAITLYLPSLPLKAALGVPQAISIGLVGVICIIYSSFGGIKAVTWTNLYHAILLIFAMLSILLIGTWQCGGIKKLLVDSYEGGRWSLGGQFWQLDLTTRHTIYNTLFGYTLVRLFLHGNSQMQVQSALSLSTMRRSQISQLLSALMYFLIQILASAIGLVLYVAYKDCDPFLSGEIKRQDELLVHYVIGQLSSSGVPAIQGLFLAAIFGSTLTAISSFQSSTSAMVVDDFVRPLWNCFLANKHQLTDELAATVGKAVASCLGTSCILISFQMEKISGLQQAATTLYGVVGAPILACFLLGTLSRKVNTFGMFCGLACSISFGTWVFVSQIFRSHPLEPSLAISTSGCPISTNASAIVASAGRVQASKMDNLTVLTDGELDDQVRIVSNLQVSQLLNLGETNDADGASLEQEGCDVDHVILTFKQLTEMSYLWLPLFTLAICMVVAFFMSWLSGPTGGESAKRKVDDKLLAPILRTAKKDNYNNTAEMELFDELHFEAQIENLKAAIEKSNQFPGNKIGKIKHLAHKNSIEIYAISNQEASDTLSSLDQVLASNMKL